MRTKMYTLVKTNSSANTKKHLLSFLLFSIAVFIACSVIVTVFHNDAVKHETHPINHSVVCQWINEGKLCSRNTTVDISLAITPFFFVITTSCIFATGLILTGKYKENSFQLNHLFLSSAPTTRAPPLK